MDTDQKAREDRQAAKDLKWIALGLVAFLFFLLTRQTPSAPPLAQIDVPHRVTYRVSGKAIFEHNPELCPPGLVDPAFQEQIDRTCKVLVSLTYANAQGATEQIERIQAPWSMGFSALPGQFLYVSAQITTSGSITCTILVDGTPVQTATSDGQYTIATCSGSVPSSRRSVGQAEAVGIIAVPGGKTDKGLYGAYANVAIIHGDVQTGRGGLCALRNGIEPAEAEPIENSPGENVSVLVSGSDGLSGGTYRHA